MKSFIDWVNPIKLPKSPLPSVDTLKELQNFREVEAQTEELAKKLNCQPNEMLTKLNKILCHIEQLDLEKRLLEEKATKPDESIN